MAEPPEGPVTFVNRFTVSGEPERFEAAFAETSRFMAEQAGFVRHTLLRALDRGAAVGYVNVAEWTDAASFRAAVGAPGFARHAAELRALCSSDPALYEPVLHVAGAVAV
ncbi:antibiotic biosynthesis monooxygenase family protein [Actinokineospora bangkokensis]|uniref:ABM domain-containing protein n=1 Tax=Actinokineospora bangkokensis TaxID=1193682 RepID=A0A1Q9LC41_9PSEU|nr:antibiotic biosynthesis monooxygenase [Actinokineospora bangkokensis]OLR89592.1 hypothetical protein BJP25_05875 [Actinokineospora bangkokensis]